MDTNNQTRESYFSFYALLGYFWKNNHPLEEEKVLSDLLDFLNQPHIEQITSHRFSEKEIYNELCRLSDLRVVKESSGSVCYSLSEELKQELEHSENPLSLLTDDDYFRQIINDIGQFVTESR